MAESTIMGGFLKRGRVLFIWTWLWLVLWLLLFSAGCVRQDVAPKAVGGVLDLRGVDSFAIGSLALDGQWRFYWDRLLSPEDLAGPNAPQPEGLFELPGSWRGRMYGGRRLSGSGQATFCLRLLLDPGAKAPALWLKDLQMAYRLWANGTLVAQSGIVGRSVQAETPQRSLRLAVLPSDTGTVDLVLQLSNHHFRTGGVPESIQLAPIGMLEKQRSQSWALALFFAGSILIIGVYHLSLFLVRRRFRATLYFGLYCLLTMAYIVSSNTSQWVASLFVPAVDPAFMENFSLLCFMAWPSLRFRFFRELYPNEFHRMAYRLGDLRVALFMGFVFFAPGVPLYWYVLFCLAMSMCYGVYNMQRLLVCVRCGRSGAWLMLAGCGIHMVTGINDVLMHAGLIRSAYVVPPGMFLFVLFQAIALGQYFSNVFDTVARLSGELEHKNLRLQQEMAERDLLAREVVHISEEERRRISHELHDGLCQKLTGARLRATALARRLADVEGGGELTQLAQLLEASADDAYKTSRGLWPVEHDPAMHGPSLGDLARAVSDKTGMNVTFEKDFRCVQCGNPHTTAIYRIAQEALANAVKHSQARNVRVTLCCEESDKLVLRVWDDGIGRGAATDLEKSRSSGLGLSIMAHRARIIGAELRIEDAPGHGTVVTCVAPCEVVSGMTGQEARHG